MDDDVDRRSRRRWRLPDLDEVSVRIPQAMYELLKEQRGFGFVVRFRGVVKVTKADGETKSAVAWTPNNGRSLLLRGERVTKKGSIGT